MENAEQCLPRGDMGHSDMAFGHALGCVGLQRLSAFHCSALQ